jgi:hypothetical protein
VDASAARAATLKSDIAAAEAAHEHTSAQLAKAQQALRRPLAPPPQRRHRARRPPPLTVTKTATAWAAQLARQQLPDEATFTAARLPAACTPRLEASVSSTPTSGSRWPRASPRTSRRSRGAFRPTSPRSSRRPPRPLAASEAATKHQANVKSSARRGRELVQELERASRSPRPRTAEYRAVEHLSARGQWATTTPR